MTFRMFNNLSFFMTMKHTDPGNTNLLHKGITGIK